MNVEYRHTFDEVNNDKISDVISQVKDIVYGFIDKNTGERYDNREWIHNCRNLADYYQTNLNPLITLKNKLGICLDQSILIKYLINDLHPTYTCNIYALRKGRFGHAVPCYCDDNNKWFYFENAWDKEKGLHGPFTNEDELKQYLNDVYYKNHYMDNKDPVTVELYNPLTEGISLYEYKSKVLFECITPMLKKEPLEYLNEASRITKEQKEYADYLINHISNTKRGFFWIEENAPEMLAKCNKKNVENNLIIHDESKYSKAEYLPYSNFFYGPERTEKVNKEFRKACDHHFMHNPHHPEFWHGLEMPEDYIIEMICDWWSFSWKDDNLTEIFNFWETKAKNSKSKSLNPKTKERVGELLGMLKDALKRKKMI